MKEKYIAAFYRDKSKILIINKAYMSTTHIYQCLYFDQVLIFENLPFHDLGQSDSI